MLKISDSDMARISDAITRLDLRIDRYAKVKNIKADAWDESKHPRGQPGNAGQFGPGGAGGGGKSEKAKTSEAPETKAAKEPVNAASQLYQRFASKTPATEAERIKRGAEIAKKVGADKYVADARERMAKSVSTDKPVSKGGFTDDETGEFIAERKAVHKQLLDEMFSRERVKAALPPEGEKPTMVVLGGRGGSGKSWLTDKDGPVDKNKTIVIDADYFKERLPGYEGWNAGDYHEESSHLVDEAAKRAKELGLNVCFDITMKSSESAPKRILQFESAGYDVEGYYMFASPETATENAMGRFARGMEKNGKGRFVPPEIVMSNEKNEENFDKVVPRFKKWAVYDNNNRLPTGPKWVAGNNK